MRGFRAVQGYRRLSRTRNHNCEHEKVREKKMYSKSDKIHKVHGTSSFISSCEVSVHQFDHYWNILTFLIAFSLSFNYCSRPSVRYWGPSPRPKPKNEVGRIAQPRRMKEGRMALWEKLLFLVFRTSKFLLSCTSQSHKAPHGWKTPQMCNLEL